MIGRFPGKSRRMWYDPEDAFSEVTLEVYQEALKGDFKSPPDKDDWTGFLYQRMRKSIWLHRRRDERNLSAEEGAEELLKVAGSGNQDPARQAETKDELVVSVPQVKEVLSSKQQAVFFATAQDMTHEEAARCAGTTPGAARVHAQRAERKMKKLRERLKRSRVA